MASHILGRAVLTTTAETPRVGEDRAGDDTARVEVSRLIPAPAAAQLPGAREGMAAFRAKRPPSGAISATRELFRAAKIHVRHVYVVSGIGTVDAR
ncbi:hypothetical protein [Nocardia sp. NBC_00403]|uniref:hypothetical protein n=1 Tax=Nocardia sp. NBC_00403 TaxID=2975990 RepID=UPI002E1BDB53